MNVSKSSEIQLHTVTGNFSPWSERIQLKGIFLSKDETTTWPHDLWTEGPNIITTQVMALDKKKNNKVSPTKVDYSVNIPL